jgi:hypothetical protein
MHTATRLALAIAPRIAQYAPAARTCAFGLYAKMNDELLRQSGFDLTIDGEFEEELVAWTLGQPSLRGEGPGRVVFRAPSRDRLLPLDCYATLRHKDQDLRVGFVTSSRGCKHTCRHCPVVPVYQGKFRVVPIDIVLADIEAQVDAGAEHISFGDPDFLNGPRHAIRIAAEVGTRWPDLTWDCVIKVEHLLQHRELLPQLRDAGLLFVTTAAESVNDRILEIFHKGHTAADFELAVQVMRTTGIGISPTFVPFTPWTTLAGYLSLLNKLVELDLHEAVAPVQLVIRLLVPQGSWLTKREEFRARLQPFDPQLLGFPWSNDNPAVDELQRLLCDAVGHGADFETVWRLTHEAAGTRPPDLCAATYHVPTMSEPWYCCAEPTEHQLSGL